MNHLQITGRNITIRIFAGILLISIFTIVTYQLPLEFLDTKKLIQQIVRFGFTILIMYFVFQGKNWARVMLTILCTLAIFLGIISLFVLTWPAHIAILLMILIYGMAVYHLNASVSFKAYFKYLQEKS
ncbi:hypothetical protein [Flavobacterium psychrotrophum]|uniref:hypothetical protein n=1 Tax=Flavobacterium psychrotrophum TaxID=2294119 RepID=UPI000E313AF9|nr:hypothetical protein [Flavobacterium psychrotrophum]